MKLSSAGEGERVALLSDGVVRGASTCQFSVHSLTIVRGGPASLSRRMATRVRMDEMERWREAAAAEESSGCSAASGERPDFPV